MHTHPYIGTDLLVKIVRTRRSITNTNFETRQTLYVQRNNKPLSGKTIFVVEKQKILRILSMCL